MWDPQFKYVQKSRFFLSNLNTLFAFSLNSFQIFLQPTFWFVKHISKFPLSSYDDTEEDNMRKTKLQHIQQNKLSSSSANPSMVYGQLFCVSKLVYIFQYIFLKKEIEIEKDIME